MMAVAIHQEGEPWRVANLTAGIIARVPPQVRVLPTKFPNYGGTGSYSDQRFAALAQPVDDIIRIAYHIPPAQLIFSTPRPTGRFDYIANLPHGSREALQSELKGKFGLIGRREARPMDVLLLRVKNPHAAGLVQSPVGPTYEDSFERDGRDYIESKDGPMIWIRDTLEQRLNQPVIDRTGLTQRYSYHLTWAEPDALDPDHAALKQALLDQIGLELVPSRETVEMLVVEKAPGS
jgi:uncharacterized protein (TIGR03435 family)